MFEMSFESIPESMFTSGRDLHSNSESKEDYASWFQRIYGNSSYVEGKDYKQCIISVVDSVGNTVNLIDHKMLPHMAMEAVLLSTSETGHAMRRASIKAMRTLGNPDCAIEWTATLIQQFALAGDYSLAKEFLKRCPEISKLRSGITYEERISQTDEPRTITEIGRDYGLSAVRLNRILESMDVQYRVYGTWRLRPTYDSAGYVVKESHGYGDQEGAYHEGYRLKWTQKGQLFIYNLLKSIDIHPQPEAYNHG